MAPLNRFEFHLSSRTKKLIIGAATIAAGGFVLAAATAGVAVSAFLQRKRAFSLQGKVVFITGGSRGLGLAMAEEFARRGAQIAICARDAEELERARQTIQREARGTAVMIFVCDVSDREQVEATMQKAQNHFGSIDVLVNNAGVTAVGPIDNQTIADFEEAMKVNFWSQVYTTLATLPAMRRLGEGRIVNITSIGGKVSIPHLLPHCCSKFAAVAFSEGLRAELAKADVKVVTVVPGLMRTGSHINAEFKGKHSQEFTWFSLSGTNPVTSISVARAAKQIVDATVTGRAELIVSWQAELLARFHGLAPGLTTEILGLVNRTLPSAGDSDEKRKGQDSQNVVTKSPLTALGQMAAKRYNQTSAN